MTLAKTGIRRGELVRVDLVDIDWETQSIQLKPTPKRTDAFVFFDGECSRVLERWFATRDQHAADTDALFTNRYGDRLKHNGYYEAVTKHAEAVGLHDSLADRLQDKFTPHCCRHWFTTHLRRAGMPREIDREELHESYLAFQCFR